MEDVEMKDGTEEMDQTQNKRSKDNITEGKRSKDETIESKRTRSGRGYSRPSRKLNSGTFGSVYEHITESGEVFASKKFHSHVRVHSEGSGQVSKAHMIQYRPFMNDIVSGRRFVDSWHFSDRDTPTNTAQSDQVNVVTSPVRTQTPSHSVFPPLLPCTPHFQSRMRVSIQMESMDTDLYRASVDAGIKECPINDAYFSCWKIYRVKTHKIREKLRGLRAESTLKKRSQPNAPICSQSYDKARHLVKREKNIMEEYRLALRELFVNQQRDLYDCEEYENYKKFLGKTANKVMAVMILSLCRLHGCGYVHRDIKPQNILLRKVSGEQNNWIVRLSDFGLTIHRPSLHRDQRCQYSPIEWFYYPTKMANNIKTSEETFYGMDIDLYQTATMMLTLIAGIRKPIDGIFKTDQDRLDSFFRPLLDGMVMGNILSRNQAEWYWDCLNPIVGNYSMGGGLFNQGIDLYVLSLARRAIQYNLFGMEELRITTPLCEELSMLRPNGIIWTCGVEQAAHDNMKMLSFSEKEGDLYVNIGIAGFQKVMQVVEKLLTHFIIRVHRSDELVRLVNSACAYNAFFLAIIVYSQLLNSKMSFHATKIPQAMIHKIETLISEEHIFDRLDDLFFAVYAPCLLLHSAISGSSPMDLEKHFDELIQKSSRLNPMIDGNRICRTAHLILKEMKGLIHVSQFFVGNREVNVENNEHARKIDELGVRLLVEKISLIFSGLQEMDMAEL